MLDFVQKLKDDLLEQFKEKEAISALNEAIGIQMNELTEYFDALHLERGVLTAYGKQLDGVGDIVGLSRMEAGALACVPESVYVLNDDEYRTLLLFKIWKNTNHCTYYDILKAFRMFWPLPLHYREDPEEPATMILESDLLSPEDDAQKLLKAPIIKAAGVGVKVIAITQSPEVSAELPVGGVMGRGYSVTTLPELIDYDFTGAVRPVPVAGNITETILPEIEEVST